MVPRPSTLFLPAVLLRRPTTTTSHLAASLQQQRAVSWASIRNLLPQRASRERPTTQQDEGADTESALKASTPKGLFDSVVEEEEVVKTLRTARGEDKKVSFHKSSTANFKTSKRKLNDLSRLIAGRGADEAILQLKVSPKKQAPRLLSMLALARDHAIAKGLDRDQLVVAQSWTSKGPSLKRLDIKGRGRQGIKHHQSAKLHVLLAEGATEEQKRREKKRDQWRSSIRGLTEGGTGVGRGGQPIINVGVGGWKW